MKQTAMQMAINHYKKLSEQGSNQAYVVAKFLEQNFLEVEKEQITDAWNSAYFGDAHHSGEDFYNKTFKSE